MANPSWSDPTQRRFLAILVLAISLLFLAVIRDFVLALIVAGILTGLSTPLMERLAQLFRGRRGAAAGVTLLIGLLAVAVPVSAFLGIVVAEAVQISQAAGPWIERELSDPAFLDNLLSRVPFAADLLPDASQLAEKGAELASAAGSVLADSLIGFSRGTADFVLMSFIVLYAMYFFLVDGRQLLDRLLGYVPMAPELKHDLVGKFVSVARAVLKGSFIVGTIQGVMAGLGLWVAGIAGAAFWTTVMILLSVIPLIGSGLVWVPAVIYLFAVGNMGAAIGLALWCALVVGSIDNVLRPILVGRDTKMPDLLVLIGTLGGIYLFGFVGFILGPIVVALFLAVWEQYGEAVGAIAPATGSVAASSTGSNPESQPER